MLKIQKVIYDCDVCGQNIVKNYSKIIECGCGQKIKYAPYFEDSDRRLAFDTLLKMGYSMNEIRAALNNVFFTTDNDMIEYVKKYVNRTNAS